MEVKSVVSDIKSGEFSRVYLIYGEEDFLRNSYKNRLADAIVPPHDNMNRTLIYGKDSEEDEIIGLSETLPFMAPKRLILVEDSGFFKSSVKDSLPEYLKSIPEETVIIFNETEVDRKRKMYKAVEKNGKVVLCERQRDGELIKWIGAYLSRHSKKIRRDDAELLLRRGGNDMYLLKGEMDKLISFLGDREEVERSDIDSVCSVNIRTSVFSMIDSIAVGKQKEALKQYYDMILLNEEPILILRLLLKEFDRLMLIKELSREPGYSRRNLAGTLKIPEFAIGKYVSAAGRFSVKQLHNAVKDCLDTENEIKNGRIDKRIGTEMLIIKYSKSMKA